MMEQQTAYLVMEDGSTYKGVFVGAQNDAIGEVVFTTGMTGYIETLTDPSYYGQIVIQTFPLIGNYGIISEDFESKGIGACAYIVKNWCQEPSNFRNEGPIDTFFKGKNMTGMSGIDTRTLTMKIRENGTMNGMITSDLSRVDMAKIKAYKAERPVLKVASEEIEKETVENPEHHVVIMDFGMKYNIKRELLKRNCNVTICPGTTPAEEIIKLNPDGILLSNGPGDPEDNVEAIETVKALYETDIPIFGICLGHQIMALAAGFKTEKMHYGHRGANQPCKNLETGRTYVTSQNHGYTVDPSSIDTNKASMLFENVNDKTCEGLRYNPKAFSVQFHPEACGGPNDSNFLFDTFVEGL